MTFDDARAAHIALGSVALGLYWLALATRKGSARHRAAGRPFFGLLLAVAVTVGPLIFLRPVPFDPGQVVQFVYLALCLGTVTLLGWSAIRWKGDPARFRGLHLRLLGPLLLMLGGVVLAAGVARGDPVPVVLSWVGLAYGAGMLHFARMRAPLQPRWWLSWHLHAVCGLFTAVHGTLLAVAWRTFVDPGATRADTAICHVVVLVLALAMRVWFARRFAAPWGFGLPRVRGAVQA